MFPAALKSADSALKEQDRNPNASLLWVRLNIYHNIPQSKHSDFNSKVEIMAVFIIYYYYYFKVLETLRVEVEQN